MTTQLIKSSDRGYADHGWLKSFHSFSFADYYDPARMGFGPLRVINEDKVAPGKGFGTHGHRDMEIISYVLSGELAHKDSMGNGEAGAANAGVIRPGDVQRMSAGTGVMHSEFNNAKETTHFLQIWIQPDHRGIAPSYEQKHFDAASKRGKLRLVAANDGEAQAQGAVTIHADAKLYAGLFDGAEQAELALADGRLAYIHVVRGSLNVNGQDLTAGDALQVREASRLALTAGRDAEVLVFDLAA
ncbi:MULTISPECIES: pirin family protein [unclassified Roseateles]|uniref:pirin family protein n=1 Tax=unclassified Roseateles TaxID=2626991 RepID=UPI0006F8BEAE|nr:MULTISPECIES: pirin family protein [unclassified Roseateles]KQW42308.1 quercetin 2,3-dioxygenase [Pelomonas sp. Root405]KRA68182.1 quercetin 2,3-dioxygenase [Pelomonas sp. Root662]